MASEKLRQREVHKYYQSWLDSSIGFDATPSTHLSRYHADGSQLRTSKDKALIAFAQLGCLRLNVKRTVVTLISTEQQYILAEATRTLSLVSGDGDFAAQDEIWFGNAVLPRSQGVSGDALAPPEYEALGVDGTSYTAPALVIDDMTVDGKYHSRPYAGKGVTFYCGVPILTDTGVPIGVYSLTDDKPRNGLKPDELRFMHDIAAVVMRHLEIVSNEAARFRGETMVLGLGKFVSGARSLREEVVGVGSITQATSTNVTATVESSPRPLKGLDVTAANPSRLRASKTEFNTTKSRTSEQVKFADTEDKNISQEEGSHTDLDSTPTKSKEKSEVVKTALGNPLDEQRSIPAVSSHLDAIPDNIFSRAAKILRECVAADGVLFFDAVATNFAKGSGFGGFAPHKEPRDIVAVSLDTKTQDFQDVAKSVERKNSTASTYSGASEESDMGGSIENEKRMCKLLGHALDEASQSMASIDVLQNVQMTERSLSRLVKLYPQGKLFTFHSDSGFSASDGEHLTEDASSTQGQPKTDRVLTADRSRRIPRAIARELERLVPHAQSIIWLPLWDFSKQRWSAGLFLWSRRVDRLVAAQDDLVYLKAFANSIMVEVARMDAARADTAKSTFIANISHELRTPLHGILGNLDILQDTKLSEFQQSLVTAIEVCGRTLSDTIDHVLDYSKINQLSKYSKKRSKSASIPLPSLNQGSLGVGGSTVNEEDFDIAAIVEEAVEAAYASHAFQTNGRTRLRASSLSGSQPAKTATTSLRKSQNVHVLMNFEHRGSWLVHSQPSAIRRVVTNLFGNALKYTDLGTIQVSLSSARLERSSESSPHISIVLSVKDTGRGMSRDFLRNHAFMPFSQESQFSTGTGLGLSIVQQIVKSLGGSIELQSDQGVGTEISVFLSLPALSKDEPINRSTTPSQPKPILQKQSGSGLSLAIPISHESDTNPPAAGLLSVMSSLETMAQHWFDLRIESSSTLESTSVDIILYMTPPSARQLETIMSSLPCQPHTRFIVVALNTIEKATLTSEYAELPPHMRSQIDVISYPVGPHKLGQALLRCVMSADTKSTPNQQENGMTEDPFWSRPIFPEGENTKAKVEWNTRENTGEVTSTPGPSDVFNTLDRNLQEATSFPKPARTQSIFMEEPLQATSSYPHANPQIEHPEMTLTTHNTMQPQPPPVLPRSMSAPPPFSPNDAEVSNRAPMRILLVDDNDINLNILKTCMKRARVPYDFAKDGLEASNTFQHAFNTGCRFTHVLMDISMPVMDGIQSTREIRDFEQRQSSLHRVLSRKHSPGHSLSSIETKPNDEQTDQITIPKATIIALSGVASEVTQLEMLEAGADMFLPKPVKLKELLRILGT